MRKVVPEIWRDEFIIELNHLERLLWVGLIVTVADDQGRLQNNLRVIKAEIFPCDDLPISQVEEALDKFDENKRILIYQVGKKSLIQILNWWRYQISATWMAKSKYPPPEGWQDRYRAHVQGGGIETSPNWETKQAGFLPGDYLAPAYSLPSRDADINGEGNNVDEYKSEGEVEGDAEADEDLPPSSPPASSSILTPLEIYQAITAQKTYPEGQSELIEKFESLLPRYSALQEALVHLTKIFSKWASSKRRGGNGYYSPKNMGWVEWAIADLLNTGSLSEKNGQVYVEGKYADYIEH